MTAEAFAEVSTLHELMSVAIEDGERILKQEEYLPDAWSYCEPQPDAGMCRVCLAGMVLVATLGHSGRKQFDPDDSGLPRNVLNRVIAIDRLRGGEPEAAYKLIHPGETAPSELVNESPRLSEPMFLGCGQFEEFLASARRLRDWLRERGL